VIDVIADRQTQTPDGARQFLVNYLVRAVLRRDEFQTPLVLAELRGNRLSLDQIIDIYIPHVATVLGDMWVRSELNFAQVTIGSMRLQSLLGEAAADILPISAQGKPEMSALVVIPEGEQHFLGASVLSAQLRRMGIATCGSFAERDEQIIARIEIDTPSMVLFTAARLETLEVVQRTVKKIKTALAATPVLALGGSLRGNIEGFREKTGVDLVTNTAKDVVSFTTKRCKSLAKG
jgi:hypothetical protein